MATPKGLGDILRMGAVAPSTRIVWNIMKCQVLSRTTCNEDTIEQFLVCPQYLDAVLCRLTPTSDIPGRCRLMVSASATVNTAEFVSCLDVQAETI